MAKVQFIPNLSKEILLFPSRIDEDIADDAPVRIIDHVLDKIDISNILKLYYCCPVKLFKQNKLGLTLLTRYQPFWLSLFCEKIYNHEQR